MAKPLEWLFNLLDKVAGPATRIADSLDKMTAAADKAASAATRLDGALMTLDHHAAVARGLSSFFGKLGQASLSMEEHTKVAQAMSGIFGGLGKMSDQHQIGKGLVGMFEGFSKLEPPAKRFRLEWGNMFHSFAGLRKEGDRFVLNMGEGLSAIGRAASSVVRTVIDLGGALARVATGAAGARERSSISFRSLMGTQGGGDLLDYLDKIQKHTEFTPGQLRELVSPLVAQGFGFGDITRMVAGALDVGAAKGTPGVARALELFAKIKSTGRVEGEAFTQLGLDAAQVLDRLAAQLGLKGLAGRKSVKERIEQGKIGASQLIGTLLQAIAAQQGGNVVGGRGVQVGGTVDALLNKLRGAPAAFLETLETSPVFTRFRAWLGRLAKMLDPTSAEGKRFTESIGKLFNRVLDTFESIDLSGLIDEMTSFVYTLRGAWNIITEIVGAIPTLALLLAGLVIGGPIGLLGAALVSIGIDIWESWDSIAAWFDQVVSIGSDIIDGIVKGITGGIDKLKSAIGGVVDGAVGWFKNLLGIRSPSTVFAKMGEQTMMGYAQGIGRGAGGVEAALGSAIAIDDVAAGSRFNTRGGGGVTIQFGDIVVHVTGGGEDGRSVADQVREGLGDAVLDVLERLNLEGV